MRSENTTKSVVCGIFAVITIVAVLFGVKMARDSVANAAAANAPAEALGPYHPGVYTASANGFGGRPVHPRYLHRQLHGLRRRGERDGRRLCGQH